MDYKMFCKGCFYFSAPDNCGNYDFKVKPEQECKLISITCQRCGKEFKSYIYFPEGCCPHCDAYTYQKAYVRKMFKQAVQKTSPEHIVLMFLKAVLWEKLIIYVSRSCGVCRC